MITAELAETQQQTRTLAFLFSDLRGYTNYIEAHGDTAAAQLVSVYRGLVRSVVTRYGGTEIGTEGDSFFVVFESVASAIRCGIEILALNGANEPPIRLGIGIHAGEAASGEHGYVAGPVNVAARLCALAHAGDLVVTDTVRTLTRTAVDARFQSMGPRRLKGIEDPIPLWRIEVAGAARSADDNLPSAALIAGMFVAALLSFAQITWIVATVTGHPIPPLSSLLAASAYHLFLPYCALSALANLVVVWAVATRSATAARTAARTMVACAVMVIVVAPYYEYLVVLSSSVAAANAALVTDVVVIVGGFWIGIYGLFRRRPWAVMLAYGMCVTEAAGLTLLPVALAGAWAIRQRRESALY